MTSAISAVAADPRPIKE